MQTRKSILKKEETSSGNEKVLISTQKKKVSSNWSIESSLSYVLGKINDDFKKFGSIEDGIKNAKVVIEAATKQNVEMNLVRYSIVIESKKGKYKQAIIEHSDSEGETRSDYNKRKAIIALCENIITMLLMFNDLDLVDIEIDSKLGGEWL